MDNKIICDMCDNEFKITEEELKTELIKDIKILYFECPECGQAYVYKIIDEYVRLQERKIEQYKNKLKDIETNLKDRTRYYKNFKKCLKNNIDYQRRLKNRYKGVIINEKTIK